MIISNFNYKQLEYVSETKLFSFVNPYSYYLVDANPNKLEFTFFADGILLVKLYNLFNIKKIKRYSFDYTSLAPLVFEFIETKQYKLALIGSSQVEIESAAKEINIRFPNLNIVFLHHGFIKGSVDSVIEGLNISGAEVVISGMGTPFQEEFLIECKSRLSFLKLGFTCGGFLSQIASNPNYFSPTMNKLNLRWLQRFIRHGYVRKRVLINYPKFVLKYLKENLSK